MLDPAIHADRREHLSRAVDQPILLMGNGERPRNLPMATVSFRQDSTFLYFTGCTIPGAALLIVDGKSTLFLPEPAEDDALWHGVSHTIQEMALPLGFAQVKIIGERNGYPTTPAFAFFQSCFTRCRFILRGVRIVNWAACADIFACLSAKATSRDAHHLNPARLG